mmetsp:Transcript_17269/g.50195  ORF Transcript_17269/g.50195 Transcript_17269/m.50195 type:complete len:395 (+) Transcript_17269:278-1462(+)
MADPRRVRLGLAVPRTGGGADGRWDAHGRLLRVSHRPGAGHAHAVARGGPGRRRGRHAAPLRAAMREAGSWRARRAAEREACPRRPGEAAPARARAAGRGAAPAPRGLRLPPRVYLLRLVEEDAHDAQVLDPREGAGAEVIQAQVVEARGEVGPQQAPRQREHRHPDVHAHEPRHAPKQAPRVRVAVGRLVVVAHGHESLPDDYRRWPAPKRLGKGRDARRRPLQRRVREHIDEEGGDASGHERVRRTDEPDVRAAAQGLFGVGEEARDVGQKDEDEKGLTADGAQHGVKKVGRAVRKHTEGRAVSDAVCGCALTGKLAIRALLRLGRGYTIHVRMPQAGVRLRGGLRRPALAGRPRGRIDRLAVVIQSALLLLDDSEHKLVGEGHVAHLDISS